MNEAVAPVDPLGTTNVWRRELLPPAVERDRRTPVFTPSSMPPALRANHSTSVWACLEVEAGTVWFVEDEPAYCRAVSAGEGLVLVPERPHRVEPYANARFAVSFYRAVGGDSAAGSGL